MTIRVTCAKCGSQLKIKDELAGKRGHCPKCKAELAIPALAAPVAEAAPVAAAGTVAEAAISKPPDSDAALHMVDGHDAESSAEIPESPVPAGTAREPVEAMAGKETVAAVAPSEDTSEALPLTLEPDDDLDEAPALMAPPKPEVEAKAPAKSKSSSAKDDFDPAEFLMEEPPTATKKPSGRSSAQFGPNLDLIEKTRSQPPSDAEIDSQLTPAPPTKSSSAAADAWDHAKAAKQMMKAIKQSNSAELKARDEKSHGESFDYVGAFKELGVKGLGGLALVLVAAVGLYYVSARFMGGGPKLPPLGYVTGTVKLDGKPLEGATVCFAPHVVDASSEKREPLRASYGITDANGFYRMYYIDQHQGVAIGQCRTFVTLMGPNGRDVVPPSYSEAAARMHEVKAGSQTVDFDMTSKQ